MKWAVLFLYSGFGGFISARGGNYWSEDYDSGKIRKKKTYVFKKNIANLNKGYQNVTVL